jgi:hypothetical protein
MVIIIKANDLLKTVRDGFWKHVYAIEMNLPVLICANQGLCTSVLQRCSSVQNCLN